MAANQCEYDFNRICRTCKNASPNMFSLFERNKATGRNNRVDKMLMKCTSVQVHCNDGLPSIICQECISLLRIAYDFKEQCELTDSQLRMYQKTRNDKEKTKPISLKTEENSFQEGMENVDNNCPDFPMSVCQVEYNSNNKEDSTTNGIFNDPAANENVQTEKVEDPDLAKLKIEENEDDFDNSQNCSDSIQSDSEFENKHDKKDKKKRGKFPCNNCSKVLSSESRLEAHRRTHKIHVCTVCTKTFSRTYHLNRHMKTLHKKQNVFLPATQSSDQPEQEDDDEEEENTFDTETKDICIKEEPNELENDKEGSSDNNNSDPDFVLHKKGGGSGGKGKMHKCPICKKIFARRYRLQRHILTHSKQKPEPKKCNICSKSFLSSSKFYKHKKLHISCKEFECDICKQPFVNSDRLANHMASVHNIGAKKKYICSACQKSFATELFLNRHVNREHSEGKQFICKVCKRAFALEDDLVEHEKIHTKNFLCNECGHSFLRQQNFMVHMRRHRGEKPYKCRFCGKGFPRTIDCKVHERYHTGEKSHICTVCGKGFCRASTLQVHMRTHTGEKPYKCTYCDAAYTQSNDLKAHIRRHTGERFYCEYCGESFITNYLLTHHKRNIHGLQVESKTKRINPPCRN